MRIDTNSSNKMEPGFYKFKISAYPQAIKAGDYDKFQFEFTLKGFDKPIKQSFFPNQMKELLLATGMKEVEKGIFDCDIQDAYNKNVEAELYFRDYVKKDGTQGKARELRNFKACEQDIESQTPESLEWEE